MSPKEGMEASAIASVFQESSYYYGWEDERRSLLSYSVYKDCVVNKRLEDSYDHRSVKKGFKFDFILFSLDDGEEESYFYGFSQTFYKSEEKKKMIRDICTILMKPLDDYSEETDGNSDSDTSIITPWNVFDVIESMTSDTEVFSYGFVDEK